MRTWNISVGGVTAQVNACQPEHAIKKGIKKLKAENKDIRWHKTFRNGCTVYVELVE
jgi:hypothetical protein